MYKLQCFDTLDSYKLKYALLFGDFPKPDIIKKGPVDVSILKDNGFGSVHVNAFMFKNCFITIDREEHFTLLIFNHHIDPLIRFKIFNFGILICLSRIPQKQTVPISSTTEMHFMPANLYPGSGIGRAANLLISKMADKF